MTNNKTAPVKAGKEMPTMKLRLLGEGMLEIPDAKLTVEPGSDFVVSELIGKRLLEDVNALVESIGG